MTTCDSCRHKPATISFGRHVRVVGIPGVVRFLCDDCARGRVYPLTGKWRMAGAPEVVTAARVAVDAITKDRGGWSDFDNLTEQEPIAALARSLTEIDEDGSSLGQQMVTKGGSIARDMEQYIERGSTGQLPAALQDKR